MTIVVVSPHKAAIVLELSTPYVQDRVLHPQLFDYEVHTTTMGIGKLEIYIQAFRLEIRLEHRLDFCKLAFALDGSLDK